MLCLSGKTLDMKLLSSAKTLVIYGSFGVKNIHAIIKNWSEVVVLEVDTFLPEEYRCKCAAIETIPPLLPTDAGDAIQNKADQLLDLFLEDLVIIPGVLTSRRFRAACLSIDAWRIVVPYLVCLEYVQKVAEYGPFDRIIVSPGAGVSELAFKQLGQMLSVPVHILEFDRRSPPLIWMMKRRWQRFIEGRNKAKVATSPLLLPKVSEVGSNWCSDSRLEAVLASVDANQQWVRGPVFSEPSEQELAQRKQDYQHWWKLWWEKFQKESVITDPLSPYHILEELGLWASEEVYPRHSILLKQAEGLIAKWHPCRILIGSMRGRVEFLWGLAAQDQGIPVVVYTVDCHIDPKLCFKPDIALCDDARQLNIALANSKTMRFDVSRVQSHRKPSSVRELGNSPLKLRKKLLLADTYYAGVVANSSSLLSFWAYQRVIEVAKVLPEYDFYIKFHPVRERPEHRFHFSGLHHLHLWIRDQWIKTMKPSSNVRFLAPEVRLSDKLSEFDLLLNIQSYAGLEAFALRLPVVYLQPLDQEGLYPLMREQGVMQIATSTDRLHELIELNLNDENHLRSQLDLQNSYLDYFYADGCPNMAEAALSV